MQSNGKSTNNIIDRNFKLHEVDKSIQNYLDTNISKENILEKSGFEFSMDVGQNNNNNYSIDNIR